MKNYIVTLALIISLTSCSEENETVYSVDPALAPYVETFYTEAAERGVTVPKNLVAEFEHIQGISQSSTSLDQNYLRLNPEMLTLDDKLIEAHVYYRLAQVFLKIDIDHGVSFANPDFMFTPYQDVNREAMFDAMFSGV